MAHCSITKPNGYPCANIGIFSKIDDDCYCSEHDPYGAVVFKAVLDARPGVGWQDPPRRGPIPQIGPWPLLTKEELAWKDRDNRIEREWQSDWANELAARAGTKARDSAAAPKNAPGKPINPEVARRDRIKS